MEPYIYVINLKRRTDRYQLFLSSWDAVGLSKERLVWHEAVDGRTLPDAAFVTFKGVTKNRQRLAGQLGCFLSHVTVIQKAIDSEHFPLLILEDDAVVTGPIDLSAILATAPPDARLLYLGGLPVIGRARAKMHADTGFHPLGDIRMYGGHAYVIPNKSAAAHILEHLQKHQLPFDSSLVRYQKMHPHVYAYSPFVFYQRQGISDIEGVVRW